MSNEMLPCPYCKKVPMHYCNKHNTKLIVDIECCGHTVAGDNCVEKWNNYVSAINLLRAETELVKTIKQTDLGEEIHKAYENRQLAFKHAIEVFKE